jgi:hypothetical protein
MINEPRGSIDYAEAGKGPTVVFVPGSCSTGAAHFMIATHPRELADLITRHVIANEPALRIHRDPDSPDAKRIGDLPAL